jgi:hypothetical protein
VTSDSTPPFRGRPHLFRVHRHDAVHDALDRMIGISRVAVCRQCHELPGVRVSGQLAVTKRRVGQCEEQRPPASGSVQHLDLVRDPAPVVDEIQLSDEALPDQRGAQPGTISGGEGD